jgi:hypothetical protein
MGLGRGFCEVVRFRIGLCVRNLVGEAIWVPEEEDGYAWQMLGWGCAVITVVLRGRGMDFGYPHI